MVAKANEVVWCKESKWFVEKTEHDCGSAHYVENWVRWEKHKKLNAAGISELKNVGSKTTKNRIRKE